MSADTFKVIPRMESDGRILLILPDLLAHPGYLVCYSRIGQHSECSREYYRRKTRPVDSADPGVMSLVSHWCALGEPCFAVLAKRCTT